MRRLQQQLCALCCSVRAPWPHVLLHCDHVAQSRLLQQLLRIYLCFSFALSAAPSAHTAACASNLGHVIQAVSLLSAVCLQWPSSSLYASVFTPLRVCTAAGCSYLSLCMCCPWVILHVLDTFQCRIFWSVQLLYACDVWMLTYTQQLSCRCAGADTRNCAVTLCCTYVLTAGSVWRCTVSALYGMCSCLRLGIYSRCLSTVLLCLCGGWSA